MAVKWDSHSGASLSRGLGREPSVPGFEPDHVQATRALPSLLVDTQRGGAARPPLWILSSSLGCKPASPGLAIRVSTRRALPSRGCPPLSQTVGGVSDLRVSSASRRVAGDGGLG